MYMCIGIVMLHVSMYTYKSMCSYMCMHIFICIHVYVSVHVYGYVYYVCISYMCVCIFNVNMKVNMFM